MPAPITNMPGNFASSSGNATISAGSGPGGLLSQTKDSKDPSTDPKFGEILGQIQSKYGAKEQKAREIKKTLGKDDFLKILARRKRAASASSGMARRRVFCRLSQATTH